MWLSNVTIRRRYSGKEPHASSSFFHLLSFHSFSHCLIIFFLFSFDDKINFHQVNEVLPQRHSKIFVRLNPLLRSKEICWWRLPVCYCWQAFLVNPNTMMLEEFLFERKMLCWVNPKIQLCLSLIPEESDITTHRFIRV